MRLTVVTLLSAAIFLATGQAQALDWKTSLPESEAGKLPPETRVLYDQAMTHIDRIDYDGGVVLLAQAAEKSPDVVELQFFTLARARDRAEVYYSAASYREIDPDANKEVVNLYSTPPWRTSENFYDIAEQALRRLQENSSLGTEEKRRAGKEASALEAGRNSIHERDKQRFESATTVIDEIYQMRKDALKLEDPELTADRLAAKAGAETAPPTEAKPATEEGKVDYKTIDPFAPLPGEYTQSITDLLPAPVQPGQLGGAPGGEFADPALAGGTSYFGAPPADVSGDGPPPAAAPAPGGDPFGGGGGAPPAAAPPAADPFGGK